MALKTLEVLWEDIHTDELTGHRVRVTVLDTPPPPPQPMSLADTLRNKVGIVEGASPDLSEKTDE
ncbi:MAG: hypothetical protein HC810_00105 [Acaryochloridaceae cyanobacterium RL_2_7]|nr:hypothetical protein [Acaryochloridaceae cyanobacterium RL_2_7]